MSFVSRLAASKHLRALKRADTLSESSLEDAKARLIAMGPGVIGSLIESFPDTTARPHVIDVLTHLVSDETLPAYIAGLTHETEAIASGVAEVLLRAQDYRPELLLEYLSLPGRARGHIETILAVRASSIPHDRLVSSLIDTSKTSRAIAFHLLETHAQPAMVGDLIGMLRHEDWWVRLHALKLLGRLPAAESEQAVIELLGDPNRSVRLEAVQTLGRMGARGAVPQLCHALRDPNLKVQTAAIDVLIELNDSSAVRHLLDVLKDESEQARRGAVEVLNAVATPEAIRDLVLALQDSDWWVQARAADALGTLGGSRVVDAVLGLMEHPNANTRRYAVEILNAAPDPRATDRLIAALEDGDWWVRERSIDALGKTGDERAVAPLIRLMQADTKAAPLCAGALAAIGDARAVEPICALAASENADLRQAACDALRTLAEGELPDGVQARVAAILHGAPPGRPAAAGPAPPARARSDVTPEPRTQGPAEAKAAESMAAGGDLLETLARTAGFVGPTGRPPAHGQATLSATADDLTPAAMELGQDLRPGTVLAERYRVVRRIGSGGFGTVYLVNDITVKEDLILKVLSPHISVDPAMIQRFVHELKYARRITHKNVIRIYDLLQFDGGHAISMEFFPGRDLGAILAAEGRLSPDRALRIAAQVCSGLTAAHGEGVIHRDIKPANIMVGDEDLVKIVDFGLAAITHSAGSRLTKSGILIGTPQYMAPEQIKGDDVDGRTDIYSLGIVLYEMLAGRPPYQGDNAVGILFQHLEAQAAPLRELAPQVPPALEALVASLMAKDRDARPDDVEVCLSLIERAAA